MKKTKQQIIQSLKDAIEFMEQSSFIPCSINFIEYDKYKPIVMEFNLGGKSLVQAANFIFELKNAEKKYSDSLVHFSSNITENLRVKGFASRGTVCRKKVIGVKRIERQVIPEYVIEEHDVEIVEWDCSESILGPEEITEVNSND